jgi:MFS family permease
MVLWFILGLGYSTAQTPSGRLLRRSSHQEDRPALFAAQFALSHACWLLFYPLAGWFGTHYGFPLTFAVLGSASGVCLLIALSVWPSKDPEVIEHEHTTLPTEHAQTQSGITTKDGVRHAHSYVIDDYHPNWPHLGG